MSEENISEIEKLACYALDVVKKIYEMKDKTKSEDFWSPLIRRIRGLTAEKAISSYRLMIPFFVLLNKQREILSETEILDCILLGGISSQRNLFEGGRGDVSDFVGSKDALKALWSVVKNNQDVSLGVRNVAEKIFNNVPFKLQESVKRESIA